MKHPRRSRRQRKKLGKKWGHFAKFSPNGPAQPFQPILGLEHFHALFGRPKVPSMINYLREPDVPTGAADALMEAASKLDLATLQRINPRLIRGVEEQKS